METTIAVTGRLIKVSAIMVKSFIVVFQKVIYDVNDYSDCYDYYEPGFCISIELPLRRTLVRLVHYSATPNSLSIPLFLISRFILVPEPHFSVIYLHF